VDMRDKLGLFKVSSKLLLNPSWRKSLS